MVETRGRASSSIVEALSGKTMLLTGVTGFLAQVVFERLLADFPETRVVLLVRSQTGASSRDRVEYLFRKPAFDTLRERVGEDGLKAMLDDRVEVIDADFGRGQPEIPGGIDVAMHSAATVSFDPPIDEGFMTNLQGAMNLYGGVIAGGSTPALVHVSTAYVAGVQKGVIPEGPLEHRVDYMLELELAMAARKDVEAASRKPEMLNAFMAPRARRAFPRRPHDRRRGRRGAPAEVGDEAARRVRAHPRAFPRMARRLHVHEGDGRARGRGARGRGEPAAVDRAPVDHRVGATRTRSPGGSTASRWPTRSSARTGSGRSRSSPASPRASSTSSRSTSS